MRDGAPTVLELRAAWVLVIDSVLSLVHELWRATVEAGTSRHDSVRVFLTQNLMLYMIAVIVVALLFLGVP